MRLTRLSSHLILSIHASLAKYDHAILPGVGSFGPAMRHLIDIGFDDEIREFASKKKICFGHLSWDATVVI